jgi:ferrous iron transport protein A
MKKLSELNKDNSGVIANVNGDARFVSRITSIGLTPGCSLTVIKNEKRRPVLVYSRDTMIALNRNECDLIDVEETSKGAAV